jgi:hypothetical protein
MRNKVPDLRNKIGAVMGIFTLLGSLAVAQVNFLPEVNAAPTCENMSVAGVKAIGYEGTNVPKNVIDNKITTRWSNEGAGSWITLDLGEKKTVCRADIAWYKGLMRVNDFVIAASTDGSSFTNIYSGKSSGKTTFAEKYSFTETAARYIKITVNDSTDTDWASITEIDVYGYAQTGTGNTEVPTENTDTTATDTIKPSVRITEPAKDSTVTSTSNKITVKGTASDNVKVKSVEVRVDDGTYKLATPKAAGDWSSWTISVDVTAGQHRLVPRVIDTSGNKAWNSIYVTVKEPVSAPTPTPTPTPDTSGTLDKFGIKKLYPTVSGGNEWFVNMADPYSDPLLKNRETLTKQSDGSWQVSGGSNGQVRLEAWSPENKKWLNVEITEYAKIVSGSNELLQLYSRGGHHTSSNECLGSAIKARLYGDGEARWVKEVNHPAYTSNRGAMQATDDPLKGRWIGFKAVIYNFVENGKTYVRMESYIDDDVTDSNGNLKIANNWKLASVVQDKGGWSTSDSDFNAACAPLNKDSTQQYRQRDEIINTSGGTSTQNIAAFRSDNLTWNWKYLSVREIVPPS